VDSLWAWQHVHFIPVHFCTTTDHVANKDLKNCTVPVYLFIPSVPFFFSSSGDFVNLKISSLDMIGYSKPKNNK